MIFINTTAQVSIKKTVNEITVSGTTYIISRLDSVSVVSIENKSKSITGLMKQNKRECSGDFSNDINIKFKQSQNTAVRNVISKEKIAKLITDNSNNYLALRYVCNKLGEIKAVAFFHVDISLITLEEIKLIEKQLLELKINFTHGSCPETKYFYFTSRIRYKDLISNA